MSRWLGLAGWLVALDQFSKWLAEHYLLLHQPVAILPGFNLTLVYNPGAAFSFLSDAGGWQRWLFSALSLGVSVYLIHWLYQLTPRQRLQSLALSCVLGGALGNFIDRALWGHVIDFIDWYYGVWHWPAFNLADSAISLGVVLLLVDQLRATPSAAHPES